MTRNSCYHKLNPPKFTVPSTLVIKPDTVVFYMSGVFAIVAGGVWLQHPTGTTCQLGLLLPAYIIRGTLILSAQPCFWILLHSHCSDCFGLASTIFFLDRKGLSFFVFLQCLVQFGFHCGNLAARASVLPLSGVVGQMIFSIPTNILIIHCHRCCMYCLHALTPATEHQCPLILELSEALGVRQGQTLSPGHYFKVGSLRFWAN